MAKRHCPDDAGQGEVAREHPLVMGGLGEGGSEASTALLNEADIIFMIGATWWL